MQHSSGLYKKIAKLNNPKEIEKWREERRKMYPTKVNIDKKAAALKEKIERGEKINLGRKEWHTKRDNDQNRHSNSGTHTFLINLVGTYSKMAVVMCVYHCLF